MTAATVEAAEFTTTNPCPAYCNLLPGHHAGSVDDTGRESRGHGGPASEFGPSVSGGSIEFLDQPGIFHASVWVVHEDDYTEVRGLLDLADQIIDAAAWLIDQKEAQK